MCSAHGSRAPQVRAAAQRRRELAKLEIEARALAAVRGPLSRRGLYDELLATAGEVVEWRNLMRERVEALKAIRYMAHGPGTEQLRSEVALYERALDRTAKVLDMVARLDLDARKANLDRAQGDIVAALLQRIFDGLFAHMVASGLDRTVWDADWQRAIADVVPREIHTLVQEHSP